MQEVMGERGPNLTEKRKRDGEAGGAPSSGTGGSEQAERARTGGPAHCGWEGARAREDACDATPTPLSGGHAPP